MPVCSNHGSFAFRYKLISDTSYLLTRPFLSGYMRRHRPKTILCKNATYSGDSNSTSEGIYDPGIFGDRVQPPSPQGGPKADGGVPSSVFKDKIRNTPPKSIVRPARTGTCTHRKWISVDILETRVILIAASRRRHTVTRVTTHRFIHEIRELD